MPNIDLIVLVQPAAALAIALGALVYWWRRRGVRAAVLTLSFCAYFIAIAAKYAIQVPTISAVMAAFGPTSVGLGLYYGLQTVFLEVGLAYLFALYGVRKANLKSSDAVSYGLSLSFWENGVLLGALALFNLVTTYLLLSTGGALASAAYGKLAATQPALFLPPARLLPSVLIGTLERVSSMLAHIAWGVLVVLSAATGRKRYLAYALPMGLIDALVPFAHLNIDLFEGGLFLLCVGFVVVAWQAAKSTRTVLPAAIGG